MFLHNVIFSKGFRESPWQAAARLTDRKPVWQSKGVACWYCVFFCTRLVAPGTKEFTFRKTNAFLAVIPTLDLYNNHILYKQIHILCTPARNHVRSLFPLLVHIAHKFYTNIHTLYSVHFHQLPYILHSPDNTFDSFHTAPYSFLLITFQQKFKTRRTVLFFLSH